MTMSYEGAVVLVTGASTGLGRAIAIAAAQQGARAAIINYASSEAEARVTADAVMASGTEAVLVRGDVGQDADCRRIAAAADPFGRIDVLFNNAGITRVAAFADLDALDGEDFLDVFRINVVGVYQMVRAARALLEASESGAVVNTSSVAGVIGGGSSMAYAASKSALNTLTRSLAGGLAPTIRVNAICPGFMDSPWFDKLGADAAAVRAQIEKTTPLQVASRPEDVAETALFLGSRAARHITGETLIVDAGFHLGLLTASMRK